MTLEFTYIISIFVAGVDCVGITSNVYVTISYLSNNKFKFTLKHCRIKRHLDKNYVQLPVPIVVEEVLYVRFEDEMAGCTVVSLVGCDVDKPLTSRFPCLVLCTIRCVFITFILMQIDTFMFGKDQIVMRQL